MKKILSILMILVLVSGAAFAQVEPKFSGSATLSWGIDLGYGTDSNTTAKPSHGFLNEASASVSMPFVKSGASKGEGDVYAFINLSGVGLGLAADMKGAKATGKIGGVEAKIVIHGVYITVYNAPDMTTSYAHRIIPGSYGFTTGFEGYGTKIGFAKKEWKDLDVGLKLVSNGSWKDRDANFGARFIKEVVVEAEEEDGSGWVLVGPGQELRDAAGNVKANTYNWHNLPSGKYYLYKSAAAQKDMNGQYGFGLDFHMTPVEKYLTVDANFNMTFGKADKYQKTESDWGDKNAMGIGLKLSSSPIEGLNINLGFDGGSAYKNAAKKGVFAWALGFGVDYKQSVAGKIDFGMYVSSDGTSYGKGCVVDAKAVPPKKGGVDMAMTLGYRGLPIVEGLDLHARLNVFRLLSKISDGNKNNGQTIPLGFNFGVSYNYSITDSMSIKPYADIWGETNRLNYKDGTLKPNQKQYFGLAYKLGVSFMPMERLTIDACWEQGKLSRNRVIGFNGYIPSPIQHKANNGKFILSAKITY